MSTYSNISKIHFEKEIKHRNLMLKTKQDSKDFNKFNDFLNYKLTQNVWNKMEKSNKIGQNKKSLISTALRILSGVVKI